MTKTNVTATVDRLGELKARIAELEREEKELRDTVVELGPGAYEGERYRVTVSATERSTLDMEAVREKLSAQFIRAHTKTKEVTVVRVTARNNINVA